LTVRTLIINNAGIVCDVKRVSIGAYTEKKGQGVLGDRKKEMSDISLNNGQVGLFLDSIYFVDRSNSSSVNNKYADVHVTRHLSP